MELVMPLGLGVDIIAISRMKDILNTSGESFINKVFTPWEKQRIETHQDKGAYAAMLFAAKEAIFKTFGIGWHFGVQFNEIEVREGEFGEPAPVLSGKFAEIAAARGVSRVLLSLSYDGEYAIAVAALSGKGTNQNGLNL
jgi:holo-[acyl-carrier protein] synthase